MEHATKTPYSPSIGLLAGIVVGGAFTLLLILATVATTLYAFQLPTVLTIAATACMTAATGCAVWGTSTLLRIARNDLP